MRRIGIGLLSAVAGYVGGAVGGALLVLQFSGNMHDREVEAAMTGAFLVGPAAAVVAFALGVCLGGRHSSPPGR